jgi:hypothetical protein
MPRRLAFLLLALLALALPIAACGGDEEELDVIEGEPIEADEASFNVVLSRFLNPDDEEDEAYLVGQPEAPPGEEYFGIFMQVANEGDEPFTLPEEMSVIDTLGATYASLETESPYALPLGEEVPAGGELPVANSVAADGPTQGSLVLYLLEQASTENRPLELEIPLPSGKVGIIELDI